jgi:competence protein ComEA
MWTAFKVGLFLLLCITFLIGWYVNSNLSYFGIPSESGSEERVVYLSGAVASPGVYEFSEGETLLQLVERSGGFSNDADYKYISENTNLATKLQNQQKAYFPFKNEIVNSNQSNRLININTASKEELESLPGIGESTAKSIIEGRPYEKIDKLLEVKGIGEAKFNSIKALVQI